MRVWLTTHGPWIAASAVAAAAATGAFLALRYRGIQYADSAASVFGGVVVVAGLLVWAKRATTARRTAARSTPEQLRQAQGMLANLVLRDWQQEIRARGLANPEPLAVRWNLTELPVTRTNDVPARTGGLLALLKRGQPRFSGRTDRIEAMVEQFRRLPRQRLVILGSAGMGKTTLAVLLVRELLRSREDAAPVPVLVSLSSWDPDRTDFADWLTNRLEETYPALRAADFGPGVTRSLVELGRLIPVLDGLDELPADVRPRAVAGLNAAVAASDPLILTCRTAEYQEMVAHPYGHALTSGAVIEPASLSPDDVAAYVADRLPPGIGGSWPALISRIRTDRTGALSRAMETPLAVALLSKVHVETRTDPAPLLDPACFPDVESVTDHLFDHLIEAAIDTNRPAANARRGRRRWNPARTRRWLSFLARDLDAKQSTDLTWWTLRDAIPLWLLRLAVGLGIALPCWLMTQGADSADPLIPFTFGVLGGVLVDDIRAPAGPTRARLRALTPSALAATACGLILMASLPAADDVGTRMRLSVILGVLFGLSVHLLSRGAAIRDRAQRRGALRRGLAADALLGVLVIGLLTIDTTGSFVPGLYGMAFAAAFAVQRFAHARPMNRFGARIATSVAVGITFGLSAGRVSGLYFGMLIGLLAGLLKIFGNEPRFVDVRVAGRVGSLIRKSLVGVSFGVATGATAAVTFASPIPDSRLELLELLWLGAYFGLALGFLEWAGRPLRSERPQTARLSLGKDLRFTLLKASLVVAAMILARLSGPHGSDPAWVFDGLGFFSGAGVLVGAVSAGTLYLVTVLHLTLWRRTPWRLMRFLDDAHELGLLRRVGPVYQFRHVSFQRYLARTSRR